MKNCALLLLVVTLFGCGRSSSAWDDGDKASAIAFWQSLDSFQQATKLENAGPPGKMRQEEVVKIRALCEEAYTQSKIPKKETLAKIHKDLPEHFASYFQEGLRLRLKNLKEGDAEAEIKGSALLDSWIDWANTVELRVPKSMLK